MTLARVFRKEPRAIADELVERLHARPLDPERIAAIEIAGPGFINFRFAQDYLHNALRGILVQETQYGRSEAGKGERASVEYVSANPTRPLSGGDGRQAVLGGTVACVR